MKSCFVRLAGPLVFGAVSVAQAQLVQPKTVPVHQDEQFAIFPSARAGMGGVSIALDDSLADPFNNPSRAVSVRHTTLFSAPFDHSISGGHGGGHTVPMGGIGSSGDWSGSFIVAFQRLNRSQESNPLNAGGSYNRYTQLGVARRLPNGFSVGASAYRANIEAIDGFDLLYDGADGMTQQGRMTDVRLGATKEWTNGRFEMVLLNNSTNIRNTVQYSWNSFSYGAQGMEHFYEVDEDYDRTNIWGLHTQFSQDVGDGWRFGWIATANKLTHPAIPNYEIRNVPIVRFDPGSTYAYDFGVGVSRQIGGETFGLDIVQEPMSSKTWGDAQEDMATRTGGTIRAGERTVDNAFKFSNSKVRMGWQHDFRLAPDSVSRLGFQLGLSVYNVNYELTQDDHVNNWRRVANEGWHEVSPTLGLHFTSRHVSVRYNYRMTCSTNGGTCDFSIPFFGSGDKVTVPPAVSIIAAPTQAVRVNGGTARYHQFVVSLPVR